MTNLGIRVPAGFTITTEACLEYFKNDKTLPKGLWEGVQTNLKKVEKSMGAAFGDPYSPLLVSVRSGAKFSMPGMMDTVLNVGLNDDTLPGLINKSKNERFAYDAYRRFITMFGDVVLGIKRSKFEEVLAAKKQELGVKLDTELDVTALSKLVKEFKALVKREREPTFPMNPLSS